MANYYVPILAKQYPNGDSIGTNAFIKQVFVFTSKAKAESFVFGACVGCVQASHHTTNSGIQYVNGITPRYAEQRFTNPIATTFLTYTVMDKVTFQDWLTSIENEEFYVLDDLNKSAIDTLCKSAMDCDYGLNNPHSDYYKTMFVKC